MRPPSTTRPACRPSRGLITSEQAALVDQEGGGPAGRGGQQDLGVFGAGQGDDGPHGVALAAAWPAGEHGNPLGQGQPHGLGLLGRQDHAGGLV